MSPGTRIIGREAAEKPPRSRREAAEKPPVSAYRFNRAMSEAELSEHARRGALLLARDIEMTKRRNEALAVRRHDHLDLDPPEGFVDPDSGRRDLAPDPALVLVGRYLRRSRRYAAKAQQQLADQTGVSQSMVSRAERGKAPHMALERFVMMCRPLNRMFPLGACPHDHHCPWQPIRPPERQVADATRFLEYLLKTAGEN